MLTAQKNTNKISSWRHQTNRQLNKSTKSHKAKKNKNSRNSGPLSRQSGPDAARAATPRWGKLAPERDRRERM